MGLWNIMAFFILLNLYSKLRFGRSFLRTTYLGPDGLLRPAFCFHGQFRQNLKRWGLKRFVFFRIYIYPCVECGAITFMFHLGYIFGKKTLIVSVLRESRGVCFQRLDRNTFGLLNFRVNRVYLVLLRRGASGESINLTAYR